MKKILLILLIICCSEQTLSQNYVLYSDIRYDSIAGVDPNLLSLDIYKPIGYSGLRPVVVFIHGGYWNAGDKTQVLFGYLANLFTDSGYVFVSINYRLSPNPIDTMLPTGVRFPVHPQDCSNAVKWVFNNIHNYSGDSSKMGLIGHSAGAHLVLLISTSNSFLPNIGIGLHRIRATCSLDCGVFDLPEELKKAGGFVPRRAPLINAFGRDTSLYDDASPQFQIIQGKTFAGFLLVHQNTSDRIFSNVRFRDSLIANGYNNIQLFNAHPYNHQEIATMLGSPLDTIGETDSVMSFFRRYLIGLPTGVKIESNPILNSFSLLQNYPNPFNSSTNIKFQIINYDRVVLKVFDLLGREVKTLVNEELIPGTYEVKFDAGNLPSGVYFYRLRSGDFFDFKKMIITK